VISEFDPTNPANPNSPEVSRQNPAIAKSIDFGLHLPLANFPSLKQLKPLISLSSHKDHPEQPILSLKSSRLEDTAPFNSCPLPLKTDTRSLHEKIRMRIIRKECGNGKI